MARYVSSSIPEVTSGGNDYRSAVKAYQLEMERNCAVRAQADASECLARSPTTDGESVAR